MTWCRNFHFTVNEIEILKDALFSYSSALEEQSPTVRYRSKTRLKVLEDIQTIQERLNGSDV